MDEVTEKDEEEIEVEIEAPKENRPSTSSSTEPFSKSKLDHSIKKINEKDFVIYFQAEKIINSIRTFNFNICAESFTINLTLAKCDLCSHIILLEENGKENDSINLSSLKSHIINVHLINPDNIERDENEIDEIVIKNLLDSLVNKIEEELENCSSTLSNLKYKCTICQSTPTCSIFSKKFELLKHIFESHAESLNLVDCMYCFEKFSLKNMNEFFSHLRNCHADSCLRLVNQHNCEHKINENFDKYNWQEYFSSRSTDALLELTKGQIIVANELTIKSVSGSELSNQETQNKENRSTNENTIEIEEDLSPKSSKSVNNEEASPQEEQQQHQQQDDDADSINKQEENSKSDESDKVDSSSGQKSKPKIKKPKQEANEER